MTFWLRQDLQDSDLAETVVSATDQWLRRDWPLDTHLFRILPDERSSCAALERSDLQRTRLDLPRETRPYRWYRSAPS